MAPKVLVCDNEEPMRMLVTASLAPAGYELVEAEDGEQALELARALRPDLIVLDMMMPGVTGLELVRTLRGDPELGGTAVLMVTARAQVVDREAAEAAGVDGFVSKPFSPGALAKQVTELLEGRV